MKTAAENCYPAVEDIYSSSITLVDRWVKIEKRVVFYIILLIQAS